MMSVLRDSHRGIVTFPVNSSRVTRVQVTLNLHQSRVTVCLDKLHHTRSVAYSAELVLLNKCQISGAELIQTVTQSSNKSTHLR